MNAFDFHLSVARDALEIADKELRCRVAKSSPVGRLGCLFGAIAWLRTARTNLEFAEALVRPVKRTKKGGRT